jgi:hypothetical protein
MEKDKNPREKMNGITVGMLVCIFIFVGFFAYSNWTWRSTLPTAVFPQPERTLLDSPVDAKTGNLIAWWMSRREGTPKGELVPVLVEDPYAVFIQWPKADHGPDARKKRLFVFYDNVAKKRYRTKSFDDFLKIIESQAKGINVIEYGTCTVPRNYLLQTYRYRLDKAMKAGDRTWGINPAEGPPTRNFCCCEFAWDFIFSR